MASKANEETSKFFNLKELKSVDYVFILKYIIYFYLEIHYFLILLKGSNVNV